MLTEDRSTIRAPKKGEMIVTEEFDDEVWLFVAGFRTERVLPSTSAKIRFAKRPVQYKTPSGVHDIWSNTAICTPEGLQFPRQFWETVTIEIGSLVRNQRALVQEAPA